MAQRQGVSRLNGWPKSFFLSSSILTVKIAVKITKVPGTVADPENFGGGDLKHKTSKIRMSSPKLRVIFRPKSEIQPFFFRPNSGGLQKKKKKKKRSSPKLRLIFRRIRYV